jgi:hypothetical protein
MGCKTMLSPDALSALGQSPSPKKKKKWIEENIPNPNEFSDKEMPPIPPFEPEKLPAEGDAYLSSRDALKRKKDEEKEKQKVAAENKERKKNKESEVEKEKKRNESEIEKEKKKKESEIDKEKNRAAENKEKEKQSRQEKEKDLETEAEEKRKATAAAKEKERDEAAAEKEKKASDEAAEKEKDRQRKAAYKKKDEKNNAKESPLRKSPRFNAEEGKTPSGGDDEPYPLDDGGDANVLNVLEDSINKSPAAAAHRPLQASNSAQKTPSSPSMGSKEVNIHIPCLTPSQQIQHHSATKKQQAANSYTPVDVVPHHPADLISPGPMEITGTGGLQDVSRISTSSAPHQHQQDPADGSAMAVEPYPAGFDGKFLF